MHSFIPLRGRRAAWLTALASPLLYSLLSTAALAAPLSEADALRQALARPELAELADARLGEADADAIEAGTWANPTLELARDKTGASNETSWQIAQPIDVSGRRALRMTAAEHRRVAVAAENRVRAGERASALRRAFHDVLRQQDELRAVQAWALRFAEIGRVVAALARSGDASGYDRRRLLREQRAAEARLAETQASLARSQARLAALLGQSAEDGVRGRLLPEAPADLATLAARLAERPDLAVLAARADAASADNAAARNAFPELTVAVGGKRIDDGITRETGTLFSVSLPLPLFDRQQAGNRRTAAQAMAARAELALARQAAGGELTGLHRQVVALIDAARRYRADAVTPSPELLRIAETAWRAGESTILELLDAYKGALEAETTVIDLEWKARDASIELDQLTGHPLQ